MYEKDCVARSVDGENKNILTFLFIFAEHNRSTSLNVNKWYRNNNFASVENVSLSRLQVFQVLLFDSGSDFSHRLEIISIHKSSLGTFY